MQTDGRTVPAGWLVRTPLGYQFSFHPSADPEARERADRSAAQISGTVEWHVPVQSTYWKNEGRRYDH